MAYITKYNGKIISTIFKLNSQISVNHLTTDVTINVHIKGIFGSSYMNKFWRPIQNQIFWDQMAAVLQYYRPKEFDTLSKVHRVTHSYKLQGIKINISHIIR